MARDSVASSQGDFEHQPQQPEHFESLGSNEGDRRISAGALSGAAFPAPSNVINVDDIPIKTPKTFEQLLEEKLGGPSNDEFNHEE